MCWCLAPADSPSITKGMDINSTTVMVTWTEPQTPNGIIRYYAINVTKKADGTFVDAVLTNSDITSATVSGLEFSTDYIFSVRAFTVKYSGFSDPVTGRSGEHRKKMFCSTLGYLSCDQILHCSSE